MLLDRGWHLTVCVTDLPLQTARRPVIAHVSTTHGVAVLSMPALGPVSVRKRALATSDIWRFAYYLGSARLTIIALGWSPASS